MTFSGLDIAQKNSLVRISPTTEDTPARSSRPVSSQRSSSGRLIPPLRVKRKYFLPRNSARIHCNENHCQKQKQLLESWLNAGAPVSPDLAALPSHFIVHITSPFSSIPSSWSSLFLFFSFPIYIHYSNFIFFFSSFVILFLLKH